MSHQEYRTGYFFFCRSEFLFFPRTPSGCGVCKPDPSLGQSLSSGSLLRFSLTQSHSCKEQHKPDRKRSIRGYWTKNESRTSGMAYFFKYYNIWDFFHMLYRALHFLFYFLNLFIPILHNSPGEKFSVIFKL